MGALDIVVKLTAEGGDSVGGAMRGVGRSVNGLTDEIEDAQKKTEDLRKALKKAEDGGASMDEIAKRTQELEEHLGSAEGKAGALHGRIESIRDAGAGMVAAGGAGLLLANSFIQAQQEGADLDARLQSILKSQQRLRDLPAIESAVQDVTVKGHFESDGQTKNSATLLAMMGLESEHLIQTLPRVAAIARSVGQDQEEIADTIGEAYRQMDLGGLEEAKLYFSETQIAAVEAAKAISETAGRAKFMELMLAEADAKAGSLEGSLTAGKAAANDLARELNKAQSNIGKGASEAKTLVDGLTASILVSANSLAGFQEGAGYVLYLGSAVLTAGGSLLGLGAQLGMAHVGYMSLTAARAASATAATANAAASGAEAAAVGASGAAASGAAVGFRALALAKLQAMAVSPLGIAAAGVGLGLVGYDQLQKNGALGEDAAPLGEAVTNTIGRTKEIFTGGRWEDYDDAHRGDSYEAESLRLFPELQAKAKAKKAQAGMDAAMATAAKAALPLSPAAMEDLPPASASVAATQTAPGVATSSAGAKISNVKKAPDSKQEREPASADEGRFKDERFKLALDLPAAQLNPRGERNVAAKAGWARNLFSGLDESGAKKRFEAMATLFERESGFQNEAEMEAAKRQFQAQFPSDIKSSKASATSEGVSLRQRAYSPTPTSPTDEKKDFSLSDTFGFLQRGTSIFDVKGKSDQSTSGKASGVADNSPDRPKEITVPIQTQKTQQPDGEYLIRFTIPDLRLARDGLNPATL